MTKPLNDVSWEISGTLDFTEPSFDWGEYLSIMLYADKQMIWPLRLLYRAAERWFGHPFPEEVIWYGEVHPVNAQTEGPIFTVSGTGELTIEDD